MDAVIALSSSGASTADFRIAGINRDDQLDSTQLAGLAIEAASDVWDSSPIGRTVHGTHAERHDAARSKTISGERREIKKLSSPFFRPFSTVCAPDRIPLSKPTRGRSPKGARRC